MAAFDVLPFVHALRLAIVALLLFAAINDIISRTVPNGIPVALAIIATAIALFDHRLTWGLGFGAFVFAIGLGCWLRGWIGGADVKLLAAAAILVAPADAATYPVAVTLAGGVLAIAYLTGARFLRCPARRLPNQRTHNNLTRVIRVEAWRIRHRGPLPYACAIAAGTLFVMS